MKRTCLIINSVYGYLIISFVLLTIIAIFSLCNTSAQALTVNPRLELNGNPGTSVITDLKVTNEERQSRTYYLRSQNFNSQDETGNPSFNVRREGLATWIRSPLSITLGPGETINLPIVIDIPADASPGGHYAAIFFLVEPPNSDDLGNLGIGTKLGSLILLRVDGDFIQDADILEFGTVNKQKFFTHIPIQFYYRFQNIGEDHLKPIGDIQISNTIGMNTKMLLANTIDGSVLPKSIRRFTSVWDGSYDSYKQEPVTDLVKTDSLSFWDAVNFQARNFHIGRYTAELEVAFGTEELKSDRARFIFYIFPWQLFSVDAPAIIIALIILRWLLKRYNRYIIRKAQTIK